MKVSRSRPRRGRRIRNAAEFSDGDDLTGMDGMQLECLGDIDTGKVRALTYEVNRCLFVDAMAAAKPLARVYREVLARVVSRLPQAVLDILSQMTDRKRPLRM